MKNRFLRGTCKIEKCPYSHKVAKEKMPVCAFFLRGVCTREDCPYLHVKVNQGAELCEDFITGFCSLAEKVCLDKLYKRNHLFVSKVQWVFSTIHAFDYL